MGRGVTGVTETSTDTTPPVSAGAVIVAAGASQRMQGVDKLFVPLAGRPLLLWSVEAFQLCEAIHYIVLVVHENSLAKATAMATAQGWSKIVEVCAGGARRQDSVSRGIGRLPPCDWVVVHDGARPCVTPGLISLGLAEARPTGSAIAAVPVTDTIKLVSPDGLIKRTLPRDQLWAIQTPQVFRIDIIRAAYTGALQDVTDDASLVEKMGYPVKVFRGSYDNIKVTSPPDLAVAEYILERRRHAGG
ncbi:MAG: 2-C-methyl-D-erythritol 4-phosphate cytidylyltransferase [Chloroflexi bacterium]|nr:2-C-methyl-D-erythritol 4-phosphate cytidylyltransferase [Chloroflexota bacterium]